VWLFPEVDEDLVKLSIVDEDDENADNSELIAIAQVQQSHDPNSIPTPEQSTDTHLYRIAKSPAQRSIPVSEIITVHGAVDFIPDLHIFSNRPRLTLSPLPNLTALIFTSRSQ
jgi:hypothetical protein